MTVIPQVMLSYIDSGWVKHLEAMAHLKEGIGLRHYQQEKSDAHLPTRRTPIVRKEFPRIASFYYY
ncbi:hypothetical protein LSPH24S_04437 [Lysinibacillus sphaericus]